MRNFPPADRFDSIFMAVVCAALFVLQIWLIYRAFQPVHLQ